MKNAQVNELIHRYYPAECRPQQIESLGGAGGFSGARFWRIQCHRGVLCLRRWPSEYRMRQLEFVHQVIRHVAGRGFGQIPVPELTTAGQSIVQAEGSAWELAPWMRGAADFCDAPSDVRLTAALSALAGFHRAAEDFPVEGESSGQPPVVAARRRVLQDWVSGDLDKLQIALERRPADSLSRYGPLSGFGAELIAALRQHAASLEADLRRVAELHVQLQPCIRDIWDQHVLFQGDEVTGLIDFGAMRVDTVATDIARLLGSMASDDAGKWETGLAAYASVRPVSPAERHLLPVLDRSSVLLSGMNWLRWIVLEGRQFEDPAGVLQRLATIKKRVDCVEEE